MQRKNKTTGKVEEYDPATRFLFVPHTVTFLAIGLVALIYFSNTLNPQRSPEADPLAASHLAYANAKHGVWAIIGAFLVFSVLQGPSTCMVRPHPSFWRFVHGLMVCYLLFVVFLLFQTVDDARQFLKHLYPELGVDLPERHYGADCALWIPGQGINWRTLHDTIFDIFVVAHTFGWWAKALIMRDRVMLWTTSIAFELLELTFQHMLPNFNECWWDSWVLDVAVCNWIGIATGMWTVKYFKSKRYNWRGISEQPSLFAKAKRGLLQFHPKTFDDFRWQVFSSPARCVQCFFPVLIILLFEMNHFFLKYELWVPPANPLSMYRLCLLALLALPGMKEYYEFIESDSPDIFRKLGSFAWLGVAIALVETLIAIKFGKGMFPQPWPTKVLVVWGVVGVVVAAVLLVWSFRFYILDRREQQERQKVGGAAAGVRSTRSQQKKVA